MRPILSRLIFGIPLILALLSSWEVWAKPWIHLELGAANYGLSDAKVAQNYGSGHPDQLKPLYLTLDELVAHAGNEGVFVINDLDDVDCLYAMNKLDDYIRNQYPNSKITVRIIPKSYHEIDFQNDLGVSLVDSIDWKNPSQNDYKDIPEKDRDRFLKNMISHSKTGLTVVTPYLTFETLVPAAGSKSTLSDIRYEKENIPNNTFIYHNPDGTRRREWENKTYQYKFRFKNETETYTHSEMQNLLKLRDQLEAQAQALINKTKQEIINHPEFPLVGAFSEEYQSEIENLGAYSQIYHEMDLSKLSDFVDLKKAQDIRRSLLQEFHSRSLAVNMGLRFVTMKSANAWRETSNFLVARRYGRFYFSQSPVLFWSSLSLENEYKEMFHTNDDFWNSTMTLKEIYLKLMDSKNKSDRHKPPEDLSFACGEKDSISESGVLRLAHDVEVVLSPMLK